jgi:hypothetical protein
VFGNFGGDYEVFGASAVADVSSAADFSAFVSVSICADVCAVVGVTIFAGVRFCQQFRS